MSLIASNKNDLGKLKGLLVHPFQSKQTPRIFTVKGYAYAMGYFAGQIDQKGPENINKCFKFQKYLFRI